MSNMIDTLRAVADDPMWADHVEVSKVMLRRAADQFEALLNAYKAAVTYIGCSTGDFDATAETRVAYAMFVQARKGFEESVIREHKLKTDPDVFQAVVDGVKTYEIRFNDRNFAVGDRLRLLETESTGARLVAGAPLVFTGRELTRRVSHVLAGPLYGLADGWVILSFAPTTPNEVPK